jgi:hypothetical protein
MCDEEVTNNISELVRPIINFIQVRVSLVVKVINLIGRTKSNCLWTRRIQKGEFISTEKNFMRTAP